MSLVIFVPTTSLKNRQLIRVLFGGRGEMEAGQSQVLDKLPEAKTLSQ